MTYEQPELVVYDMELYPDIITTSPGVGDGGSEDNEPDYVRMWLEM